MEYVTTEIIDVPDANETHDTWETPTFEEIPVSAEINSYVNADL